MTVLEATDIEKSFGGLDVLEGVSLSVEEGMIQGLIGLLVVRPEGIFQG